MRCSSNVNRCGEYVSFPLATVACILSRVWLADSRSFAVKKAASLRWSRSRWLISAMGGIHGLRQAYSNSGGHRISIKSKELAFRPIILNYFYAYTAGASLLRPMVRKNREISWKQSSNTLSTVSNSSKIFDCQARTVDVDDKPRFCSNGFPCFSLMTFS